MTRDTYYRYLQNQLKIDPHYFMRLFKDTIIKDLEQEILRAYLNQ